MIRPTAAPDSTSPLSEPPASETSTSMGLRERVQQIHDEEATLGDFLSCIGDDVRAAPHLLTAAHLRQALDQT